MPWESLTAWGATGAASKESGCVLERPASLWYSSMLEQHVRRPSALLRFSSM